MSLSQTKLIDIFDKTWIDLAKLFDNKEDKSSIFTYFNQDIFLFNYDILVATCNNIINRKEEETIFHSHKNMLEYICMLYTFSSIHIVRFMYTMGNRLFREDFSRFYLQKFKILILIKL